MRRWFIFILCITCLLVYPLGSWADEYDDITKQIEDTRRELDGSVTATSINENRVKELTTRIQMLKAAVDRLEAEVKQKRLEVAAGDASLLRKQEILQQQIYSQYKLMGTFQKDSIVALFTESFVQARHTYLAGKSVMDQNQKNIIRLALQVKNAEETQLELEEEQSRLTAFRQELARQTAFLSGEIVSARNYQATLQQKIAELSARQKSIIDARSSQFTASATDDTLSDDPNASKDFNPGFSPAFAMFSIGAYTHRMGMSQYGAKGRADVGQSYRDILNAYFPGSNLEERGEIGGDISVAGHGSMNFESRYLYGIAEMPSSWSKEALKAQAILARTYALRYTDDRSREICATESCQVFLPSKADNVPGPWREAVDETKGVVLRQGGEYAKAFYSSTTGGYLTSSGWDTTDGQGTDFLNTAWERKAKSPWFYKSWYRATYSNSSASCGRSHPWLTEREMADILNAHLVRKNGSAEEVDRIVPPTLNECNVGGFGGNPYSVDEMAQVADRYGGRVSSVSGVTYAFSKDGYTGEVVFATNKGSLSISGSEYKQIFNLRAPGYLSIKNTLFAVEKK